MKNLLCENPTIILNRHAKELILKHGNYTLRGEFFSLTPHERSLYAWSFPWSKVGTKRNGITLDDLDNSYITDFSTGDLIPLYIQVPCGKCSICKDKKARDWSTRAACESQTSSGKPLFITLSYNDIYLPKHGLCKDDCQKFLKRFRINAERYFNRSDLNIRYFLCGEYGSKYHRPHYHVLLWNVPMMNHNHLIDLVDKSWSFVIPRKDKDKYKSYEMFYDDVANRYRVRLGLPKVLYANNNGAAYCMKYMRKDCVVPDGSNSTFFLSSRRNGIGSSWLDNHRQEIMNNPKYNNIQFNDIWSGKPFNAPMPRYFRDKLFPSLSKLLPKDVRDKVCQFAYFINVRNSILGKHLLYTTEKRIFQKFDCLDTYIQEIPTFHFSQSYQKSMEEMYCYYEPLISKENHLIDISRVDVPPCDSPDEKINILYKSIIHELDELEKFLSSYVWLPSTWITLVECKHNHMYWLSKEIDASPTPTIIDKAWSINRKNRISSYSETF